MAVSPLNVQSRVVVEQVVGDGYVALQTGGQTAWVTAGHNTQDESCWMQIKSTSIQTAIVCFHILCPSVFVCMYVAVSMCYCACLQMCVTCLSGSDESCVSLTVLPVDIQIWTLRQCDDHIHVTLITCHQ